jgi:hypothetical protein
MAIEFESPRFAGDPVLEGILTDPDTGTKKLQPGSPPGSVRRLQKALFDLAWNTRINPPVHDENDFVVGNYGPKTTATVLAYKTHYDIHFPPSAPTGLIDGLAGPRTFAKLDTQCVLLDEAIAAINQKAADLVAIGIAVELLAFSHATLPIDNTSGTFSAGKIAGADGAILYKRGIGAFEVHGNIYNTYLSGEFASGPFGFPISDERDDGPGFRISDFEHGAMRRNLATGLVELVGPNPPGDPEVPVF